MADHAERMGSADALVRFEDVPRNYGGVTLVVSNLSLSKANGEFLTLLGPSGSGKATCPMMLASFGTATHG